MKLSTIFIRARTKIKNGDLPYICWAIEGACANNQAGPVDRAKAKDVITSRLNGMTYFNCWMHEYYPAIYNNMTQADFREARVQWLDSLIAEFKAQGD